MAVNPTRSSLRVAIAEDTGAGHVRRQVRTYLGGRVPNDVLGRIELVVTELATNLGYHADDGAVIVTLIDDGVDIVSIDRGPGIVDIERALDDGHSTRGGGGVGLGAVRRLSDVFDIYSQAGRGTVIYARLRVRPRENGRPVAEVGALCVPHPSETVCGDAWYVAHDGPRTTLVVADGLGHGPAAALAGDLVVETLSRDDSGDARAMLRRIDDAIAEARCRGVVASAVVVDWGSATLEHAGIGNIDARMVGASRETSKRWVSHPGVLGIQSPTFTAERGALSPDATIVLASDGLRTRWSFDTYPGLVGRRPALVAAVLYRDNAVKDDATVVVARIARRTP